jgi:DNA-binding transcriptional ArsR family regulator
VVATKAKRKAGTAQEKLVKALNHPLRVQALTILSERTASPNELAKELHEGLSQVSYHITVLAELGLIELESTAPRRGAIEHYYRATGRPLLGTAEWEKLDPHVRQSVSAYGVKLIVADAARAFEGDTFDRREDRHLSRTPLLVDEEGWREVVAAQDAALEAVLDAQGASAARMNASKEEGFPVIAAMVCFEMPRREG